MAYDKVGHSMIESLLRYVGLEEHRIGAAYTDPAEWRNSAGRLNVTSHLCNDSGGTMCDAKQSLTQSDGAVVCRRHLTMGTREFGGNQYAVGTKVK